MNIVREELELLKTELLQLSEQAGHPSTAQPEGMFAVQMQSENKGELLTPTWFSDVMEGNSKDINAAFRQWIATKGLNVSSQEELDRLFKFFVWQQTKLAPEKSNSTLRNLLEQAFDRFNSRLQQRATDYYFEQAKQLL